MDQERDIPSGQPPDPQTEYMRGGKGRRDEVGRSGIYPASWPDAPRNAEVRTAGEFAHHGETPHAKPDEEQ
jgi:hypothetical protein